MKRIIFAIALMIGFTVTAQQSNYVVTTPTTTGQGYNVGLFPQTVDSTTTTRTGAYTVPAPYAYQTTIMWYESSTAGNYTGAVTMPTSPVEGQEVEIISANANLHHSMTTVPAYLYVDSLGKFPTFQYHAGYWHMIH